MGVLHRNRGDGERVETVIADRTYGVRLGNIADVIWVF
jgi:hypothetical protein